VSIVDDDVNRRDGPHLVLAQDRVAKDGAVGIAADVVVVDGGGQDLDVVDDFLDTFMCLTTFSASDLSVGRATWPNKVTVPSGSTL